MKKIIWIIIILLVIWGITSLVGDNNEPTSTEPIKIGAIYPLSGDAASWGEPIRDGVLLAVKEINEAGGINGRNIEIIFEDSKCNPKDGVNATNKLVNVDKVKYIIGDICSPVVLPESKITEENKVVIIAQGSSPDITDAGDFVFRNWPSDAYQAEIISDFVIDELDAKKIAVFTENQQYAMTLSSSFIKNIEEKGGEIIIKETFNPGDKDYRTQLSKIKDKEPDVLYLSTAVDFGLMAKQARELGIDVQIVGADGLGTEQSLNDAQGALEGAYYAVPSFNEEETSAKDLQNKFIAEFGDKSPFLLVTAHGYDAMNILAFAMRECVIGGLETECVRDELYKIKDFSGVSGTTTFDENGDVQKPYMINQIVDGKVVEVK